MRQVYGRALGAVARALGIGAPSTATEPVEFDDSNLQQVLDIGPLMPGLGSEEGWFGAIQAHIHAATGTLQNQLDIYARIESPTGGLDFSGATRASVDVWIMRCGLYAAVVGGNAITQIIAGLTIPAAANSPFPTNQHDHVLNRATSFTTLALTTAEAYGLSTGGQTPYTGQVPIRVPHTGVLSMASTSTVAATTITARATWLLWAGPRGMRPPGVA